MDHFISSEENLFPHHLEEEGATEEEDEDEQQLQVCTQYCKNNREDEDRALKEWVTSETSALP